MEFREKYVISAIIIFSGYILALAILFLLTGTDIITTMQGNEITINPLFTELGAVGLVPIILPFIVIEARSKLKKSEERKVTLYIIIYLLFQLGFNFLLLSTLIILFPSSLDTQLIFATSPLSLVSSDVLGVIWIICFVFSVINVMINCVYGWKWAKNNILLPTIFHWFLGYLVLSVATGLIVVVTVLTSIEAPTTFFLLLGFVILPALDHFYSLFGILIFVVSIFFPSVVGESAFFLGMMVIGFFYLFCVIFLTVLPFLLFYIGVSIANKKVTFIRFRNYD
ncbi:MAG: hypothetical protein ACXAC8_14395 [Candidatus Hodarchaeales archaeon]